MKKILLTLSCAFSLAASAQLNNFSVGDQAPDFTVTDLHGHSHTLSDYSGKWVVVDLFAYWCGPCAQIAPTLNDFYKKYGCNQYDIVVLSIEYEGTTAQTQAFEDANGGDPNYPTPSVSGLDGGGAAVHSAYGPAAFPTIFLVGPDGLIKNVDIWPISGVGTFETAISNAGGGSALVEHSCASSASVDELTLDASSLYPNPASSNVSFVLASSNEAAVTVEIVSVLGQIVYTENVSVYGGQNTVELGLETVENGQYIVRINDGSTVITAPLQVRK